MKLGDKKYHWTFIEKIDDEYGQFQCKCNRIEKLKMDDVAYGHIQKCVDCKVVKRLDPMYIKRGTEIGNLKLIYNLTIPDCGEKGRGAFLCTCGLISNLKIVDVKMGTHVKCQCQTNDSDYSTKDVFDKYGLEINEELYGWKFLGPAPSKKDKRLYGWFSCLGCNDKHIRQVASTKKGKTPKCVQCTNEAKSPIQIGDTVNNLTLLEFKRNSSHKINRGIFECKCGSKSTRSIKDVVNIKKSNCDFCDLTPINKLTKGDVIRNWTFIEYSEISYLNKNVFSSGLFKCKCGVTHKRIIRSLKKSKANSCPSCQTRGIPPKKETALVINDLHDNY